MGIGGLLTTAAFLGLGATAILFAVGYLTSGVGSTLTVLPGGAGASPSCSTLCTLWNAWRASACTALATSATAAAALAAANAALASASTTAALLLAAAVAASLIPFIGPAVAGPLFVAYAAAQALVVILLGRQVAFSQAASGAAVDASKALAGAVAARADLIARCTDPTILTPCLATPSPCPGVP